jgi:hypothetical protein
LVVEAVDERRAFDTGLQCISEVVFGVFVYASGSWSDSNVVAPERRDVISLDVLANEVDSCTELGDSGECKNVAMI